MGMTMTQKILAAHAGLESVEAGQLINARLDEVLGNDITTPVAINEFKKAGFDRVFDKTKINIVLDHFVPNKDIKAAGSRSSAGSLRENTGSSISSTWERWASSTPCSRRKGS